VRQPELCQLIHRRINYDSNPPFISIDYAMSRCWTLSTAFQICEMKASTFCQYRVVKHAANRIKAASCGPTGFSIYKIFTQFELLQNNSRVGLS